MEGTGGAESAVDAAGAAGAAGAAAAVGGAYAVCSWSGVSKLGSRHAASAGVGATTKGVLVWSSATVTLFLNTSAG